MADTDSAPDCALDGLGALCASFADRFSPRFFKALCDSNRVAILARLAIERRPVTVSEIASHLPVGLSVVSRHLACLRDAGILTSEKRGREVFYRVEVDWVVDNLRTLADAIERCGRIEDPAPPPGAAVTVAAATETAPGTGATR